MEHISAIPRIAPWQPRRELFRRHSARMQRLHYVGRIAFAIKPITPTASRRNCLKETLLSVEVLVSTEWRLTAVQPEATLFRAIQQRLDQRLHPFNACLRSTLTGASMSIRGTVIALLLASAASLVSSGCQPAGKAQWPPAAAREDLIPLLRKLPLVPMDAPLVVEFDVPRPSNNATATLVLGLRVEGNDGSDSMDLAQAIRSAGLDTSITLTRLDAIGPLKMPLVRVERDEDGSPRVVPVGNDDRVPGPWASAIADVPASWDIPSPYNFRYLALAWSKDTRPGRYRLEVRLLDAPPELSQIRSELLVGYSRKAK